MGEAQEKHERENGEDKRLCWRDGDGADCIQPVATEFRFPFPS